MAPAGSTEKIIFNQIRWLKIFGCRRTRVLEPAVVGRWVSFQWIRPGIDLAELAKLRKIENWPLQKLARHFGCGLSALSRHLERMEEK